MRGETSSSKRRSIYHQQLIFSLRLLAVLKFDGSRGVAFSTSLYTDTTCNIQDRAIYLTNRSRDPAFGDKYFNVGLGPDEARSGIRAGAEGGPRCQNAGARESQEYQELKGPSTRETQEYQKPKWISTCETQEYQNLKRLQYPRESRAYQNLKRRA